jgi:hypothetical protein
VCVCVCEYILRRIRRKREETTEIDFQEMGLVTWTRLILLNIGTSCGLL